MSRAAPVVIESKIANYLAGKRPGLRIKNLAIKNLAMKNLAMKNIAMKNIVICCDGTGNEISENISNVLKLYRCLRKTGKTR